MVSPRTFVLAAVGVLALAAPTLAGPVQVSTSSAQGDMGTAHNAADGSYIGCALHATAYADSPMLLCQAQSASGDFAICFSSNPVLITAAEAMTSVSDINFGWDDTYNCSYLVVANYSQPPARTTTP